MSSSAWQVVAYWVSPTGTESVQIIARDTYEDALRELRRLAPSLGTFVGDRFLKSLELTGPIRMLWPSAS
jgi:hypothetical protein